MWSVWYCDSKRQSALYTDGRRGTNRWEFHAKEAALYKLLVLWWKMCLRVQSHHNLHFKMYSHGVAKNRRAQEIAWVCKYNLKLAHKQEQYTTLWIKQHFIKHSLTCGTLLTFTATHQHISFSAASNISPAVIKQKYKQTLFCSMRAQSRLIAELQESRFNQIEVWGEANKVGRFATIHIHMNGKHVLVWPWLQTLP